MRGDGVLVVATNPAVDVEWRVAALRPEEKNEVTAERRWPGGKGVNVARWLGWCGVRARLVLPVGGAIGRELVAGLRRGGIPFRAVPIAGETRANVVVTTDPGTQYRLNPTWPVLDGEELERFEAVLDAELPRHRWVVLSGALVRGAPPGFYRRWATKARNAGAIVVVDCDGEPFRRAVAARPFLVKPNVFELAQWAGRPLTADADRILAARELAVATAGWVLVSRGAAGAWLTGPGIDGVLVVSAPKTRVRNTVGAGDAMLASTIAAVMRDPKRPLAWLRAGVRVGSLATRQEPGTVPAPKSGF